jgi:photosynthetic reaction center cytochrome c subunit
MKFPIGKPLFVSGALIAALALALFAARAENAAAPQETASSSSPKTASQQFKNIQILKDIPADQLIPAMQFITASLGVDCEYCHVEHAFEKDDKKPKQFARHMMEMMFNINNESFEGQRWVTCYTCHQGSPKPVSIPVISLKQNTPAMMEGEIHADSAEPSGESLLDKYLSAVGGLEALKKVNSRVAKGTVTAFGDQNMPVEIFAKAPDKRVSVMHMKEGESVTGYNGKVGWLSVPGRLHMMNAQDSSGARMDADLAFPADVKSLYPKWESKPGDIIEGHETWLVSGTKEGEPPLRLYLERKSNLLVRLVRYVDSPLGYNPTQIDYSDYRVADGVKIPYRWTVARPGNRFTVQVEQLRQNVPIDEAKFVPPPPPPPPPAEH